MIASAALLVALAVILLGPAARILARANWVSAEPRAALVLWQSLGLASGVTLIFAAGIVALAPLGPTVPAAAGRWWLVVTAGDPTGGLGPAHVSLLVVAVVAALWLLGVTMASAATMWWRRWRHRGLIDLVSRPLSGHEVVVVDHPTVVVYCLPGFDSRVVVTSGALRALGSAELAAALAHEQAHIRERHDLVMLPFVAWAAAVPVASARAARRSVGELIEFVADDRACQGTDRVTVAAALVRCADAASVPEGALAVGGGDPQGVVRRVRRLVEPLDQSRRARLGSAVASVAVLLAPVAALTIGW